MSTAQSNASSGGASSHGTDNNQGRPVQIISINEKGTHFRLHEKSLNEVVSNIPSKDMKISLVSVVGAFRTGKSFLLDFFLRYLKYYDDPRHHDEAYLDQVRGDGKSSWLWGDMEDDDVGDGRLEGHAADGQTDMRGFSWRSGRQRCTTGIWMWSKPFVRNLPDEDGVPGNGEKAAVILVDTQGIFDSETTQMLTASIFGLSTLISSNQIYNVVNRIQEDNLQHLALFSEYGRVALNRSSKRDEDSSASGKSKKTFNPFQTLEFLVRDANLGRMKEQDIDFEKLNKENEEYLESILSKTEHKDLRDVREHIRVSFERLCCFQLPHPGLDIVEDEEYDGRVSALRLPFRCVLEHYAHRLFNHELVPKKVHGRCIVAKELCQFLRAFCNVFKENGGLPQAQNLLDATSEANSRNALERGEDRFNDYMKEVERRADGEYIPSKKFKQHIKNAREEALETFDKIADFGLDSEVDRYRTALHRKLEALSQTFDKNNEDRNAWKHSEYFGLGAIIALGAILLRMILDVSCAPWSDVCRHGSDFFGFVTGATILAIILFLVATGHNLYQRAKRYLSLLAETVDLVFQQSSGTGESEAPATRNERLSPANGGAITNARDESEGRTTESGGTLRRRLSRTGK